MHAALWRSIINIYNNRDSADIIVNATLLYNSSCSPLHTIHLPIFGYRQPVAPFTEGTITVFALCASIFNKLTIFTLDWVKMQGTDKLFLSIINTGCPDCDTSNNNCPLSSFDVNVRVIQLTRNNRNISVGYFVLFLILVYIL